MLTALASIALTTAIATVPMPPSSPLRARIGDPDVIHAAVKAAIAAQPDAGARGTARQLGADPTPSFTRAMDEARVPDCLHPDATKHVPPRLGPIALGGILALPFWIGAIAQGKCN